MWVKIDDRFYQHPKIVSVGPLGMALQVAALCYCNQYLTDGFIPWGAARGLLVWEYLAPPDDEGRARIMSIDVGCGMTGEPVCSERIIDLLLSVGIWIDVDGGYKIHDYGDFQKSKDEITAVKMARQEAGRVGGQASGKQKPSKSQAKDKAKNVAKSKPVPVPDPDSPTTHKNACDHIDPREGFDEFWSEWPKERRTGKAAAFKAWKATVKKRPATGVILDAVRAQKRGQLGVEPKFIPHPERWIRGLRWNDPVVKQGSDHPASRPQPKYEPTEPTAPMTLEEKEEQARIVAEITGSGGVAAIEAREAERDRDKLEE